MESGVELERMILIRRDQDADRAWCATCARPVPMVSAEDAAVLAGVSRRTIYRWAEAGLVHFLETAAGTLLICVDSLSAARGESRQTTNT